MKKYNLTIALSIMLFGLLLTGCGSNNESSTTLPTLSSTTTEETSKSVPSEPTYPGVEEPTSTSENTYPEFEDGTIIESAAPTFTSINVELYEEEKTKSNKRAANDASDEKNITSLVNLQNFDNEVYDGYFEIEQDLKISLTFDNPADSLITSVTINNKEYFLKDYLKTSNNSCIEILYNTGHFSGVYEIKVTNFEYKNNNFELKSCEINTNNIVKYANFKNSNIFADLYNVKKGPTSLEFDARIYDPYKMLVGEQKFYFSDGYTILKEQTLTAEITHLTFTDLAPDKTYYCGITGVFDEFDKYGKHEEWLTDEKFYTTSVYDFESIKIRKNIIGFDLSTMGYKDNITNIQLIDTYNDEVTHTISNNERMFVNPSSGAFKIRVNYTFTSYNRTFNLHHDSRQCTVSSSKDASMNLSCLKTQTSIDYALGIEGPVDRVKEFEVSLIKDDQVLETKKDGLLFGKFVNLIPNTKYTVKLTYTLSGGRDPVKVKTEEVTTNNTSYDTFDIKDIEITDTNYKGEASIYEINHSIKPKKYELYQDGKFIEESTVLEFNNLTPNTKYKVISYVDVKLNKDSAFEEKLYISYFMTGTNKNINSISYSLNYDLDEPTLKMYVDENFFLSTITINNTKYLVNNEIEYNSPEDNRYFEVQLQSGLTEANEFVLDEFSYLNEGSEITKKLETPLTCENQYTSYEEFKVTNISMYDANGKEVSYLINGNKYYCVFEISERDYYPEVIYANSNIYTHYKDNYYYLEATHSDVSKCFNTHAYDKVYAYDENHHYMKSTLDVYLKYNYQIFDLNKLIHISNAEQFYNMEDNKQYVLDADIDLSKTKLRKIDKLENTTIVGEGHKISGFFLTTEKYDKPSQGLISLAKSSHFYNLDIDNFTVIANPSVYTDKVDAGTLVGKAEDCIFNDVNVLKSNYFDSYYQTVGGLIGHAVRTQLINCTNDADINGYEGSGGLLGNSSIENKLIRCVNNGNIKAANKGAGGLVGTIETNVSIYDSVNNGHVIAYNGLCSGFVGALLGNYMNTYVHIYNSINNGVIESDSWNVGGFVSAMDASITNCINNGDIHGSSHIGGISGGDANSVRINNCINNGDIFIKYIKGSLRIAGGIAAKVAGSYISNCINNGELRANYGDAGGICGYSYNTHIIACTNNGTIYRGSGIVGTIGHSQVINCINYGNVDGSAGIIGYSRDDFDDIYNCINYGNVSGGIYVGGICGEIDGADIKSCANYGVIKGANHVGGIIGYGQDYYYADKQERFYGLYNYGDVIGNDYVSGIIGFINIKLTKFVNCSNSGIIVGKTHVHQILSTDREVRNYEVYMLGDVLTSQFKDS